MLFRNMPFLCVMVGSAIGCSSVAVHPSSQQSHDAYASLVGYLGNVNQQIGDGIAKQGFDSLVVWMTPCDSKKFAPAMDSFRTTLVGKRFSESDSTLAVEAIRRFRHNGVCG